MFFYLICKIGWGEIIISLKKISLIHQFILLIILWVGYLFKSVRWKIVMNSYSISLSFFKTVKFFFIGLFLANITPGKLGDFARLVYIQDVLPDKKIGWSSLVMDRLFDLICLLFFSGIALIYYQFKFDLFRLPNSYGSFLIWSLVILLMILSFLVLKKKINKILEPWLKAFSANNLGFLKITQAFLITCISMCLIYGVFNYASWAMGIKIEFLGLFLGSFILGVLSLLPITILGIGVRETSLVLIFKLYGLPIEDAIALSLIVFFIQIISFIPGAIWFYLSPVKLMDLKITK